MAKAQAERIQPAFCRIFGNHSLPVQAEITCLLKMQRNSTQNKLIYDPEDCIQMIVNLKKI